MTRLVITYHEDFLRSVGLRARYNAGGDGVYGCLHRLIRAVLPRRANAGREVREDHLVDIELQTMSRECDTIWYVLN